MGNNTNFGSGPYLEGNHGPVDQELSVDNLKVVQGRVPTELHGMYVRNGPNPKYPTKGFHHWFDGDGMLHAVQFHGNGRVSYTNRFVQTARFKAEQSAGRKLFPTVYDVLDPTNFVLTMLKLISKAIISRGKTKTLGDPGYSTANTSVEYHDRRLLALVESDVPHHIRLPDLHTLGIYTYGGQLTHPFTAHPKVRIFLPPFRS